MAVLWDLDHPAINAFCTIQKGFTGGLGRAVFDGGWGVEPPPPRKFRTPPAAIKKRKGVDFLCTYALARSSTSIAKTSTPPMKFDKYRPGFECSILYT